jgi:polar amino acid transport system substrate-binding protein
MEIAKHSRAARLVLAVAVLMAATPVAAGEVLDRVFETGKIRMPDEGEWPPYSYTNDNGDYTGFDVEVAQEIARRLGVELEFVRNPDGSLILWEDQTHGNWNDVFDFVVGSMTPTAERDQYLDFPVVYYYALGALAVHKDNTTIRTPSDASGKRIGALRAANYEMYLRRQDFGIVGMPPVIYKIADPIIVIYDTESDAFDALSKGDGVELDALVNYHGTHCRRLSIQNRWTTPLSCPAIGCNSSGRSRVCGHDDRDREWNA